MLTPDGAFDGSADIHADFERERQAVRDQLKTATPEERPGLASRLVRIDRAEAAVRHLEAGGDIEDLIDP